MEQESTLQPDQNSTEQELSFFDKVTGIFTEPSNVFESIKKFEFKTIDWLIPTIVLIVVAILSNSLIMSNPEIKAEVMVEQRAQMKEQFKDAVAEGRMSQEQADAQIEQAERIMEGGLGTVFRGIGALVFIFLFLFLVSLFYWLIWTKLLKGTGQYKGALTVYGMTYWIGIIEVILVVILSFVMVKLIQAVSIATFVDFEKGSDLRYFMSKLNPFTIWGIYVAGVGLGKMFNVEKNKSLITIFVIWIVYVIIAKFIPFLNWAG
jgi:hypothetical protein